MRPALLPLLLLGACASFAGEPDTPPDPALRDVAITYVSMEPKALALFGRMMRPETAALYNGRGQVAGLSLLNRAAKTCTVWLPATADAVRLAKIKAHEERHCHGELHGQRGRFSDEYAL